MPQWALAPPSEWSSWPFTQPPSAEHRNATRLAASVGRPTAAAGRRGDDLVPEVGGDPPGVGGARVHDVGGDTEVGELAGGGEHDAVHRTLRSAVGEVAGGVIARQTRRFVRSPARDRNRRANSRTSSHVARAFTAMCRSKLSTVASRIVVSTDSQWRDDEGLHRPELGLGSIEQDHRRRRRPRSRPRSAPPGHRRPARRRRARQRCWCRHPRSSARRRDATTRTPGRTRHGRAAPRSPRRCPGAVRRR